MDEKIRASVCSMHSHFVQMRLLEIEQEIKQAEAKRNCVDSIALAKTVAHNKCCLPEVMVQLDDGFPFLAIQAAPNIILTYPRDVQYISFSSPEDYSFYVCPENVRDKLPLVLDLENKIPFFAVDDYLECKIIDFITENYLGPKNIYLAPGWCLFGHQGSKEFHPKDDEWEIEDTLVEGTPQDICDILNKPVILFNMNWHAYRNVKIYDGYTWHQLKMEVDGQVCEVVPTQDGCYFSLID